MGAKIQFVPEADASSAAARAVCSISGKSQEESEFGNGDREDRSEAMDNVVAYEQGNAEARGLDGQTLVRLTSATSDMPKIEPTKPCAIC